MPEKNLLVAILKRALFDYFGGASPVKLDAEEWLFSPENQDEEFSFEWVCEQLGNDPSAVRGEIKNWPQMKGRSAQAWWSNSSLN